MFSKINKINEMGMKKFIFLAALLLVGLQANSAQADQKEVLEIGGVGNVRFMDDTHGYASSASGPFAALSFEVTYTQPQADGSVIAGMLHDFLTPTGGWLKSEDVVIMQPIPNRPGVFSIEVTYDIYEAGHGMEGYEGQSFGSRGFINTNTGVASVRYKGSIKRKRKDTDNND